MGFCGTHTNVECRFFCNTCGIPVCHVCMEKGDHVISTHDCISVTKYCEAKSKEIRTVLEEATKHKIRYDKIKSKWDMHLNSIVGEFDKIKNEILLTKQHLLQQLDLDEELQLRAAGIEKDKLETAMEFVRCSHEHTFSGVYQQLNKKLQFLLQDPSGQNSEDNKAVFEECHKLLNNLQQVLSKFEEEDMLGTDVTFVPLQVCFLGNLVVSKDDSCPDKSELESSNPKIGEEPTRKRKQTDLVTMIPISIKKEKIESSGSEDDPSISKISDVSTSNTRAKRLINDGTNQTALTAEDKILNQDGSITSAVNTNSTHSNKNANIKSTGKTYVQQRNRDSTAVTSLMHVLPRPHSHCQLPGTYNALQTHSYSVSKNKSPVHNLRQHITVDKCCSGIIWGSMDWLFEVTATKAFIKVKYHKLSDGSQLRSDTIINCNQTMLDKDIRVCPKIFSPNCSFLLAFKDRIGIISLKGMKLRGVFWHRIPNRFTILAIAWRRDPSNYAAIVKEQDGTVSLMRDVSGSSTSRKLEITPLSDIAVSDYHPFDISPKDKFAVCNTNTGRILFFSKLGVSIPKREVLAPSSLKDGKPLSVSFIDDKSKWLALWKGNSASDGFPKWVIVLYNSRFIPVSTIIQSSYKELHEEPKAFCVRGNIIAVLYNSLKIRVHTIQPTPSDEHK
ncbi:hypothetical protein HOLleu_01828 [Holothuria leucospilota]|uniref:B box-type domain-containing protein n=1 Tax=Holothuria leucospilota TaxID=206669 RepID=A0A9Q1HKH3_HOLLE|nr:hypothetical protein HOLleu_01828 [Holothuria leucospilota]